MPKVVTSEGLTEFVQSGKHEKIAPLKAGEAPKLERVKPTPTVDVKPIEKTEKVETKDSPALSSATEAETDALTAEEEALPDKAKKEIIRAKKAVNEKHRQMREAQEAAEEAERFAQQQYNERRLERERADAAEAKAKELEAKVNPPKPEPKEPVIDDYKLENGQYDWVKFQKDSIKFATDQAKKEFKAEQDAATAEQTRQARIAQMKANADEVRKAHPDFDAVMTALRGTDADKVPNFVLSYIEESEHSAEIAYQLAKNPEVREKISKMKPILGIAELGKLEASLVKPPSAASSATAKSVTPVANGGAPAPITPLDGEGDGGHIETDPSKMSYKELRAYHKAREAERRRRN